VNDCRRDDLKRMFTLYERVNHLELLKKGWVDYIRHSGAALMSGASTSKTPFVEEVLEFQEKLENILKYSFFNQVCVCFLCFMFCDDF
jgi:hypothetical protein